MSAATPFKPLTKEDLADVLGVSIRTIENWVNEGVLPAPSRLGNRVYWHPNTFYTWLDQRLSGKGSQTETSEVASKGQLVQPSKSKPRSPPASAKTELEKVRSRTQAQLDALMA